MRLETNAFGNLQSRQKNANNRARLRRPPLPAKLIEREIGYADSCAQTKGYFKSAFRDGALVEARLGMPGFEMRVFIKGLAEGKDHGNVLAYEPDSNTVWSICVSNGKFVGAKKTHKFKNSDLQELVAGKLWKQ